MSRVIAVLSTLALLLCLAACGGNAEQYIDKNPSALVYARDRKSVV